MESACNAGNAGSIPGSEDPLEEEMATHSSILTWRSPWNESLEGYSPMGLDGPNSVEIDQLTDISIQFSQIKCLN